MSKYSNVSATSLKSAIQTALNEISTHSYDAPKQNLTYNSNVIQSSVSSVIDTAITSIESATGKGSLAELKQKLNNLSNACTKIEQIQKLEKEIQQLQSDITNLEARKYKTETHTSSYTDIYGYVHNTSNTVTVIDSGVVSQINSKNNEISNKKIQITSLETAVTSMLS